MQYTFRHRFLMSNILRQTERLNPRQCIGYRDTHRLRRRVYIFLDIHRHVLCRTIIKYDHKSVVSRKQKKRVTDVPINCSYYILTNTIYYNITARTYVITY